MFPNAQSVLLDYNKWLRLLHLPHDNYSGNAAKKQQLKTLYFYVLYSDKTWIFDLSIRVHAGSYLYYNNK